MVKERVSHEELEDMLKDVGAAMDGPIADMVLFDLRDCRVERDNLLQEVERLRRETSYAVYNAVAFVMGLRDR